MRSLLTIVALWLMQIGSVSADSCGGISQTVEDGVQANPYLYQFESGATWELCWHVDKHAGMVISRVFYGPPSERPMQVLDVASIGQVLFKYDEDTDAAHLISESGLGGNNFLFIENDCEDGHVVAGADGKQMCQRMRDLNHLTKVRNRESIRRHEISLHARSVVGAHIFEQIWRFSEDGEISPELSFSGQINRYTNDARYGVQLRDNDPYVSSAMLLVNWRLDFNINGTSRNDLIDEIEFVPGATDTNKRGISVKPINSETARTVNREYFRGWRVSDSVHSSGEKSGAEATTRVGYYLDPQSSGYRYQLPTQPWTEFDFFVTRKRECEKIASANNRIDTACAVDLDSFVNGESLHDTDTVIWFSISRNFTPRREDFPVISARSLGFKLIPFDWSSHTPFSPPEDIPTGASGAR